MQRSGQGSTTRQPYNPIAFANEGVAGPQCNAGRQPAISPHAPLAYRHCGNCHNGIWASHRFPVRKDKKRQHQTRCLHQCTDARACPDKILTITSPGRLNPAFLLTCSTLPGHGYYPVAIPLLPHYYRFATVDYPLPAVYPCLLPTE